MRKGTVKAADGPEADEKNKEEYQFFFSLKKIFF